VSSIKRRRNLPPPRDSTICYNLLYNFKGAGPGLPADLGSVPAAAPLTAGWQQTLGGWVRMMA
jgi:hypothetical protein